MQSKSSSKIIRGLMRREIGTKMFSLPVIYVRPACTCDITPKVNNCLTSEENSLGDSQIPTTRNQMIVMSNISLVLKC